jgi:hypothetical protein
VSVKQVTLVSALAVGAALLGYGMAGCELIASVDRTLIPSGTGGGVATGGGGTGGSIGGGGTGGTTGGTGGGGAPASCSDQQQNGNETDIDCGGDCPLTCANSQHCGDYTDCTSAFCDTTTEPPTCMACTTQANCADKPNGWCDASVNGGSCVDQYADGLDCTDDFQCLHGHCADGVCCNTACAGSCDKCDIDQHVGTCTPVADADPGTPSCAPYLCDGTGADCPTTCAGAGDCVAAPDAYCDGNSHCVGTVATGQPCANPQECLSTFCVDLVCCGVAACGSANDCNVCLSGSGACGTAPINHACDDGSPCNGADQCDGAGSAAGNCSIHAGNPCAAFLGDGDANCSEACNPANGNCDQPENTGACTDGVPCNGADTCGGGTCSVHAGDPCSPTGDCNHACHPADGSCSDPETGTTCTDSVFCNGTDLCNAGACTTHAGNPCPGPNGDANCSQSCNEGAGDCTLADPDGSGCNDGNLCNGADTCSGGACSTHAGDPCSPTGDCNHACNPANGSCSQPETGTSCTDSVFCNGTDTCNAGACATHSGDPCAANLNNCNPDCSESCNEGTSDCTANDPDGSLCDLNSDCPGGTHDGTCTGGTCS